MSKLSAVGVPGGAEAGPLVAALHRRGHQIVEQLLRENDLRWQSLSEADRRTVESLLLTVASRMLDHPATVRPAQVELLRELFTPRGAADENALGR